MANDIILFHRLFPSQLASFDLLNDLDFLFFTEAKMCSVKYEFFVLFHDPVTIQFYLKNCIAVAGLDNYHMFTTKHKEYYTLSWLQIGFINLRYYYKTLLLYHLLIGIPILIILIGLLR